MKANPFPPTGHIAAKPFDLIHMDVHGPVPVQLHSGMRYYAIFIDGCTKFKVGILIFLFAFLNFQAYAENQLKDTIKAIQDDKGDKFMSKEFNDHCDEKGLCANTLCVTKLS
jgi:hypothetical protein